MKIMCCYGNCQEWVGEGSFKLTLTESRNGTVIERQSFCCYEHGILWLQKRDEHLNHGLRQWRGPIERVLDEGSPEWLKAHGFKAVQS